MRLRILAASGAALALITLAGCVPAPRTPAPPPAPDPTPAPAPSPAEPPAPPPAAWEDAPLSPGDWRYHQGDESSAGFGNLFAIRCEPSRQVRLVYNGGDGNALIVRTTFGDRSLAAGRAPSGLTATLPVSDVLLDQMAFSRGRFAVEAPGAARLILPAWPELARVVEDCRG